VSNNEYREAQQQAREHGLRARQEARLENATYTAAEVKVLTEAALRLGREEVLEEVKPELDALRALWWFMNNDMGVCDGGDHAVLSWAEVTDMNDLHDAVEEIYQEHGYPPKPDATSARTDPGVGSDLPPEPQTVRSPQEDA
jgi:hypothetical protein